MTNPSSPTSSSSLPPFSPAHDYYSILGTSSDATEEEIKSAYRRMCILYHPDKHLEPSHKSAANAIFAKVHSAYTVLSDSRLRSIYDELGEQGVEAAMQVGAYLDGDLSKLREELARRRRGWKGKTVVSSGVDASMLLVDWSPIAGQVMWSDYVPTMNTFSMSYRMEGSISENTTARATCSVATRQGSGTGILNGSIARQINERLRGRLDLTFGGQRRVGAGLTVALTSKMSMDVLFACQLYGGSIIPSHQLSVTRALSDNYVISSTLFDQGVAFGLNSVSESVPGSLSVQIARDGAASFEAKTSIPLDDSTAVKFKLASSSPVQLSLGVVRRAGDQKWSYAVESGGFFGVGLKLGYSAGDLHFFLPIYISRELSSQSVLFGIGLPSLVALAAQNFLLEPYRRYRSRKYWEGFREQQRHLIQQQREEAQLAIDLMSAFYERKVASERAVDGLVIIKAVYEQASPMGSPLEETAVPDSSWDVTIPLQMLVVDSQLCITGTSKSGLLGFYDVAVGSAKLLRVEYLFRAVRHTATVRDGQPLYLPLRQHLAIA